MAWSLRARQLTGSITTLLIVILNCFLLQKLEIQKYIKVLLLSTLISKNDFTCWKKNTINTK